MRIEYFDEDSEQYEDEPLGVMLERAIDPWKTKGTTENLETRIAGLTVLMENLLTALIINAGVGLEDLPFILDMSIRDLKVVQTKKG